MTLPLIPNNHVTNSLDLLYKIQENLDLSHKIQVVGKHEYFNSKTESSHTSAKSFMSEQDKFNLPEIQCRDLMNQNHLLTGFYFYSVKKIFLLNVNPSKLFVFI